MAAGPSKPSFRLLSDCSVPTAYGQVDMRVYGLAPSATCWVACVWGDVAASDSPVLMRVHDACLTSEVLGSLKCDCGRQLQIAQQLLAQHGGLLIYSPQEGRGIGLANKLAAYKLQERDGLDTVDANLALGLPDEARDYQPVRATLDDLGIHSVELLTNNPWKVDSIRRLGVHVAARRGVLAEAVPEPCKNYLRAKAERMGHWLAPHLTNGVSRQSVRAEPDDANLAGRDHTSNGRDQRSDGSAPAVEAPLCEPCEDDEGEDELSSRQAELSATTEPRPSPSSASIHQAMRAGRAAEPQQSLHASSEVVSPIGEVRSPPGEVRSLIGEVGSPTGEVGSPTGAATSPMASAAVQPLPFSTAKRSSRPLMARL